MSRETIESPQSAHDIRETNVSKIKVDEKRGSKVISEMDVKPPEADRIEPAQTPVINRQIQ